MRKLFLIVCLLLMPMPSWAQPSLLVNADGTPGPLAIERAKFGPKVTEAEVCTILARTVRGRSDFGLLLKPSGSNCTLPDGRRVSGDVIIYAPNAPSPEGSLHFDTLYDWDGERIARPKWDSVGKCEPGPSSGCDMARFTRIEASMKLPGDGDSPPPPPPPMSGDLQKQIDALYAKFLDLQAHVAIHDAQIQSNEQDATVNKQNLVELDDRLSAGIARIDKYLADKPIATDCSVSLFGMKLTCQLESK